MSLKQLSIVSCIPQHAGNHSYLHFLILVRFLIIKEMFFPVCVRVVGH